ncbi:MAG: outer membrane protein assembly factor BamB [Chromatiales bacterium]|jgi:outer membrane protein assembly factor BamB|nr:outer membrane protein assembly factor BamB [Chromatiales bacterium]MDP6149975.1 outer membrane protein assembly factor BamB [Gammaproteobacteria bacterium]MDP7271105.1 outer membrane protein assembly factor BamB [Gammaproteobacteria bacterium]HJP04440.1 outer membrane protein assembly factor BamB [Gammaproteobacteria bacterium]
MIGRRLKSAHFPVLAGWLACAVLLGACSGNEIDPDELPAELVEFKKTLDIRKVWSTGVGGESEFLRLGLRPASDGSRIYAAAHDGAVVAIDVERGKKVWKSGTELPLSAGPATDGKLVVAGSSDGDIVALDAVSGEVLWVTRVTSEVLSSPALAPGSVIVRTVNGKLSALDRTSGEQIWSIQQSMPSLSVRGTSAPIVTRSLAVSGFDNGRVSAFDLADGSVIWDVLMEPPSGRTAIERLIDINSTVQAAGGDIYAVGYQGQLGAIAIESGQLLWSREMSSYTGLTLDIRTIYLADERSVLLALSRGSGRELWRRSDLRNRDATAPAVIAGSVVVGDFEGYLHWFDLETGDLQARIKAGSNRITSQPLVVNERLYVINDGGTLSAFEIRQAKD